MITSPVKSRLFISRRSSSSTFCKLSFFLGFPLSWPGLLISSHLPPSFIILLQLTAKIRTSIRLCEADSYDVFELFAIHFLFSRFASWGIAARHIHALMSKKNDFMRKHEFDFFQGRRIWHWRAAPSYRQGIKRTLAFLFCFSFQVVISDLRYCCLSCRWWQLWIVVVRSLALYLMRPFWTILSRPCYHFIDILNDLVCSERSRRSYCWEYWVMNVTG